MSIADRRTRPPVKEIKDAYDYLFNSSVPLSKIKDAALGGRLFANLAREPNQGQASTGAEEEAGLAGRSIAWRLFLIPSEPLKGSATDDVASPPIKTIQKTRDEYKKLLLEHMRAPDGSYEEGLIIPGTTESPARTAKTASNLDTNNPLSLHDENPWTEWFGLMELRKTILQDVERTFPDIAYFRDPEVQAQLTNILFVYSVTHPDIGYRQGMHELLAPLYHAVDYDSIPTSSPHPVELSSDSPIIEFCAQLWVAADAWALFDAVMQGAGRWYEWREPSSAHLRSSSASTAVGGDRAGLSSHVQLNVSGDHSIKPYVAPIVQACNRVQGTYLKAVDPELWRKMQGAGIEPQIYGIRWLRLLFTRECNMSNAMVLWDGLFACDPSLDLAQWICVAMLIRIRNQLIPSDYSTQLTFLLHYPPQPPSSAIHPSSLLIRQALTLQMSPSPPTGISIIHENRNLLGIPIEVPEPPPPPMRTRRPKMRERIQSDGRVPGEGSLNLNRGQGVHARQSSTPMGLPEMIARGLLERGESLGINKTVMNAVSELKKNLPDLANSLARLPTSPNQSSFADYPLVDERPPAERPPWEPRTRFEMEREATELRIVQKKLGDSLTWIVDTLLLDESDAKEEEAKAIKNRKREALESLSYVRDVLKGVVNSNTLEEERLLNEEQLKARKAKLAEEKQKSLQAVTTSNTPTEPVPQRTRLPPPPIPAMAAPVPKVDPRARAFNRGTTVREPPAIPPLTTGPTTSFSTKPPIQITQQVSSPAPSPSVLTPNSNATPLAPWNHTRSSFASSQPSINATLPRIPPRSSTILRNGSGRTPMSIPSFQGPPEATVSRDQAPRKQGVQYDPLGAIP